jgi:hypothetical protein
VKWATVCIYTFCFNFFCILFQIYNLPDPMTYFICCTLTKAACVFIVKVIKERRNPTIVLVVFQTLRFEKIRSTSTMATGSDVTSGNIFLHLLLLFSSTWRYKTFHFPRTFFPYFFKPQRLKYNKDDGWISSFLYYFNYEHTCSFCQCVFFYDFSIWFWNCSDYCVFHFITWE